MLKFIQRFSRRFVRKSTQVAQTPLNKVSLIILILIDIFVLINVFSGLYSVSSFPLSPTEEYPCYSDYQVFHTSETRLSDRQFSAIETALNTDPERSLTFSERRLGQVSSLCQTYLQQQKSVKTPQNSQVRDSILAIEQDITTQESQILTLQQQYDSTLLEKIAQQNPENSINTSTAEQTRNDIKQAQAKIDGWKAEIQRLKDQLIAQPESQTCLATLGNTSTYTTLQNRYETAQFWYPNLQFVLQLLFLVPLIALTYLWHGESVAKDRGLQSLLSWHLLLIFCIPLLVRLFEFLQFSNLVALILEAIVALVGGLWFIASYLLILLVPFVGFGLIKFLQHFIFNPKVQARKRIQKQRCLQCNAQLHSSDPFCPHCGFNQYQDCSHCNHPTPRYAPFCRVCGSPLPREMPEG